MNIYHQQAALLNDPDQNVEFIFGGNNNYHQLGNFHLGFDVRVREAGCNNFNFTNDPATNEVIKLVNNAFAYCLRKVPYQLPEAWRLNKPTFLGHLSTIMRALTSKDGYLLSHFDNIDETQNGIKNNSLKQMLINNLY